MSAADNKTSCFIHSDLEEKYEFSGKQWPIMECLGPGIVFTVFEGLVSTQVWKDISKNNHHGESGMPQMRSNKSYILNCQFIPLISES